MSDDRWLADLDRYLTDPDHGIPRPKPERDPDRDRDEEWDRRHEGRDD